MSLCYYACAALLLVSVLLTCLFVPVCMRAAARFGFLDVPKSESHKQHSCAIPLLGGTAMLCGWLGTFLLGGVCLLLFRDRLPAGMFAGVTSCMNEMIAIVVCAVLFHAIGVWDDKVAMKAGRKFLLQIAIVVLAVLWSGVRISVFIPCDAVSVFLTAFWLLFIVNAINFFDNMDGLAAGTAAIAFALFCVCALWNGQYFVACLCACSLGMAVGFWLFNRFPARIFMGDGGSHLLGFLLGIASVKVTYYNPESAGTRLAVLLPLFILAVPVFDAFAVVLIRLKNHKPIYIGDNNHISHRFLHMGCTRKQSVLLVHLLCLLIGLGALPILTCELKIAVILFLQGLGFFTVLTLVQFIGVRQDTSQRK